MDVVGVVLRFEAHAAERHLLGHGPQPHTQCIAEAPTCDTRLDAQDDRGVETNVEMHRDHEFLVVVGRELDGIFPGGGAGGEHDSVALEAVEDQFDGLVGNLHLPPPCRPTTNTGHSLSRNSMNVRL